jgi:hypothetical protein
VRRLLGTAIALIAVVTVPATGSDAAQFECSRVYGYSVTNQWFPYADATDWEDSAIGGHTIEAWADPTNQGWLQDPESPCARRASRDRVILQVAISQPHTDAEVLAFLRSAISNVRHYVPSVAQVALMPVNGGPNGEPCLGKSGRTVWATAIHAQMVGVIDQIVGDDVVFAGDFPVASCSMFEDGRGHLTTEGAEYIGGLVVQALQAA